MISRTLKNIQDILQQLGFLRAHRSYLINANKIKRVDKSEGGYVVLANDLSVPFSKQYKEEALETIRKMTTFL